MRFAALFVLLGSFLSGCGSAGGGNTGTRHSEPGSESPEPAGTPALSPDDKSGRGGAGAGGTTNQQPPATQAPAECAGWTQTGSAERASVADSNGMSAATRAREQLELGFAPAPTSIRQEDFFNYYRIDLPPQTQPGPNVVIQLAPRSIPNQYELFVGVQAPKANTRPAIALTIVADTTPSMAGVALERTHAVFQALGQSLSKGDWVNIVTTDATQGSASFLVTDGPAQLGDTEKFLSVSDGGNVGEALGRAYALVQQHFDPNALNRVLLISDGAEPDSELDAVPISDAAQKGVFLAAASTAPGTVFYDRLLGKATKLGRGAYVHIDADSEAKQMFVDRFDEIMGFAYDNVHLTFELPWFLKVIREPDTQGAAAATADPQTLAPGATMAFLFKLQTCSDAYLQAAGADAISVQAYYTPAGATTELQQNATQSISSLLAVPSPALSKAVAIRSYVTALRSVNKARIEAARDLVKSAETVNPGDVALVEIDTLLAAHPALNQL